MTGKNPKPPEMMLDTPPRGADAPGKWRRRILTFLLCAVFLAAGIAGANYIKKSAPKAQKRPPAKVVPLVETEAVSPTRHQVVVAAMGTVVPAREVVLKSRVAGEIIRIHPEFVQGGRITRGTELLKIDPTDYELAIARKKSAIADAEYALKLEMGHQDVAKREWELLKGNQPADERDIELALRKPHLAKARADLAAAGAELEQAQLDLSRATIRAPFNAMVRSKDIEVGSQISTQDRLAELIGTDLYWIRVSIPVERLKWIRMPGGDKESGSEVRVLYRNGYERRGNVLKLLGDLEPEGRMARLLVSVADPLNLKADLQSPGALQPPLLIGEYVRVEIKGLELEEVFRIPRSALRDNASLWLVDEEGRLEIRPVETIWRDTDTVLLRKGLSPGDRLVLSELSKPVAGMPVKTESAAPDAKTANQAENTKPGE